MAIKRIETIYDGFYTFRKLIIEEDGQTFEREQFDSGNAAGAIVFDTEKEEYIFVKQYRYNAETELLEIVAGVVENEDPTKTIQKEIEEETGYAVDHLEHVWDFFTSPGACTEKVYLYYAEVSKQKSAGGGLPKEHEKIKVVSYTLEKLLTKQLQDAKTIIAVQWLTNRHKVFLKHPEAKL